MKFNIIAEFNQIVPYFSLLYDQKRKDICRLKRIYVLSSKRLEYTKSDNILVCELIHLVYCINPWGQKRNISLTEKLTMFNCSLSTFYNLEIEENCNLLCKLFIIGLFLGYDSIYENRSIARTLLFIEAYLKNI